MLSILLFLLACNSETGVEGEKDPSEGTTDTGTIDPTRYDSDHDGTADAYDCEPLNFKIHPNATEKCDGIDNNCDGDTDEGDWDGDGDGYDDLTACYLVGGDLDCNDANPDVHPGADDICDGIDNDCDAGTDEADLDVDGSPSCEDCDDGDPFTFPGAAEACDNLDNDCDGDIDEVWDFDGDGYSECGGDCDEDNPDINPSMGDICDGIDNDCSGRADDSWDTDGDGIAFCVGDCEEGDPAIFPGAPEICNGLDDDCDPVTDEDVDADGDGATICDGDCNDDEEDSFPANVESCDKKDNDCNGYFDEDPTCWSCTDNSGYRICTSTATWDDASQACEGMGGYLVIIDDQTEGDTLKTLVTTESWIGLSDVLVEGDWEWLNGDPLGAYDPWAPNEPDGDDAVNCVMVNSARLGMWGDERCSSRSSFICEM